MCKLLLNMKEKIAACNQANFTLDFNRYGWTMHLLSAGDKNPLTSLPPKTSDLSL